MNNYLDSQDKIKDSAATYKSSGFGFDVSGSFDINSQLVVWADFDMVFCSDFTYGTNGETESFKDLYERAEEYAKNARKEGAIASAYKNINIIHIGAGVAYKLSLQAVDVKVGGGLFYERGFGKVGVKATYEGESGDMDLEIKANNFGLAFYADASYKFTENIGAGITLIPSIGLFNTTTLNEKEDEEAYTMEASGMKISFSMPVVIGVSYSF